MKKQPWFSFNLSNTSLTHFGLVTPSPFISLTLSNSEITSFTSWTLEVIVGGDQSRRANIAAFEALLYSAAQAADKNTTSSGIPVSFAFGWLDESTGNIKEYVSYQGWTLQFDVAASDMFLRYTVKGYASLALQSSMPVLNIPELHGFVQPSAVVEGLAKACKATSYYTLDIDHNDAPTLVSHSAMTTSFSNYVRGTYDGNDDYDSFPGLLKLSKSYNATRDAAGINTRLVKKLSSLLNNVIVTPIEEFLKKSLTDNTVQCSSFSFWVDEPTMTQPGVIHYKSNAGLLTSQNNHALEYGTANTNVISISGSYNGVAYNMTDMNFASLGFAVDASGHEIVNDATVVNSWSSSLADTFQTANIINDINAIASQFAGTFTVTIPGTTKEYTIAQPVSLIVMNGNTLSPISGIYNIVSVTHNVGIQFTTELKLQRLVMSSANATAAAQGIYVTGSSSGFGNGLVENTPNILSTGKVDFGNIYPTYEHITHNLL